MAQFARPDGDIALNGWIQGGGGTSNIYLNIDEVAPVDSDFVDDTTPPAPNFATAYQMTLSNITDPETSSGHVIRWRIRRDNTNAPINIRIELRQGGVLIAQRTQNSPDSSFNTFNYTLSGSEANDITDYTDLQFYFYSQDVDDDGGTDVEVSWAEFEVPDAPAAGAGQIIRIIIE